MAGISGYPSQEKEDRGKSEFATVSKVSEKRLGLDVNSSGAYEEIQSALVIVSVNNVTDKNGVTSTIGLEVTAHGARPGDIIRFASGLSIGREIKVDSVTDVDNFILAESISSDLPVAADTINVLRGSQLQVNSSGAIIASAQASFIYNGVPTDVEYDSVTPANNRPLPVIMTGFSGDVNVNATNLNIEVQLDHNSATPDSVQVGDGTEILLVNADGSITTYISDGTDQLGINADGSIVSRVSDGTDTLGINADGSVIARISDGTDTLLVNTDGSIQIGDGTETLLINTDGSLSAQLTDGTNALDIRADGSLTTVISDGTDELAIFADGSITTRLSDGTDSLAINADGSINAFVNGSVAANAADANNPIKVGARYDLALPTYDDGDLTNLQADVNGRLLVSDSASQASLSSLDGKIGSHDLDLGAGTEDRQGINIRISQTGGSIEAKGRLAAANSLPAVLSTEDKAVIDAIDTSTASVDAKIGIHDLDTGGGTENRQGVNLRISANGGSIEAKGQQLAASSIPVVQASDYTPPAQLGRSVVDTVRNDYSSVNVTTGAWVQLIASTGADVNELDIFDSSGQTLELGTGAAAAEARLVLVTPGGNGRLPVNIASGTRLSIRAVSANATAGELDINLFS